MLAISSHKGNANQNHTKIPPHLCQNRHQEHLQKQELEQMLGKNNPCTLMVGMQTSATTLENNTEAS
jgi:hypothetical protein